jgi:hypothetical protein
VTFPFCVSAKNLPMALFSRKRERRTTAWGGAGLQYIHLDIFRSTPCLLSRFSLTSSQQRRKPTRAESNDQREAKHGDGEAVKGLEPSDAIPCDVKEKDRVDQSGDVDHGVLSLHWSHPHTNTGSLESQVEVRNRWRGGTALVLSNPKVPPDDEFPLTSDHTNGSCNDDPERRAGDTKSQQDHDVMEQSRDDRIGKENLPEVILVDLMRWPEDGREDEEERRGKEFGGSDEVDHRAQQDWLNEGQEGIGEYEDRNEVDKDS